MIIDTLENWEHYQLGRSWNSVVDFLKTLSPETEEKKYTLQSEKIYAIITSYKSRLKDEALLEAHRNYIDIHMVISGRERIEWSPRDQLVIDVPYDFSKDAELYKPLSSAPASVEIYPGIFVILFPQDAHMPSLCVDNTPESVKKIVVKFHVDLLS